MTNIKRLILYATNRGATRTSSSEGGRTTVTEAHPS